MNVEGQELHRLTLEAHIAVHQQEIDDLNLALEVLGSGPAPAANKAQRRPRDDAPAKRRPPAKSLAVRRARLERRLAAHLELIEFARQPQIPAVLTELAAAPELAREAVADPAAFAERRGILLPEGAEIVVEVGEGTMNMRVASYNEDAPFSLAWTPAGFQPPPGASHAALA